MEQLDGGCLCERVRFSARVETDQAYACHSEGCRKGTGSAWTPLIHVSMEDVSWRGKPDWYQMSPITHRPFCSNCGTSLGIAFVDDPTSVDLAVGVFDQPERFRPARNQSVESLLPAWSRLDELPAERTDENEEVMRRLRAKGLYPNAGSLLR